MTQRLVLFTIVAAITAAPALRAEVGFDAAVEPPVFDLSTEGVWQLDPMEKNPHLVPYVVYRDVRLEGQKAVLKGDRYELEPGTLVFKAVPHMRFDKNWYAHCDREKVIQAAVRERDALIASARSSIPALNASLRGLESDSAAFLLERAERQFRFWLSRLQPVKKAEKICAQHVLEPVSPAIEPAQFPLARAPLRAVPQGWAVKVSIGVLGSKLSGLFLVDLDAESTFVSPSFLENQGVPRFLQSKLELSNATVRWSQGKIEVRRMLIDKLSISGADLPAQMIGVAEVRLKGFQFDGVLGQDLFRDYAVEFEVEESKALRLWKREGFAAGDHRWFETRFVDGQGWISDCGNGSKIRWSTVSAKKPRKCGAFSWSEAVPADAITSFDLGHGRVWIKKLAKKSNDPVSDPLPSGRSPQAEDQYPAPNRSSF